MKTLLKSIVQPADIKKLSEDELVQLAEEVRERIITVVSKNGGHLASSLGTVELTVALHYAFNCPEDKIVWDVGHQTYAHKILTGRNKQFDTLRQLGGLSGFPKIAESAYDSFGTGHASTAISAALGMATARDLHHGKEKIIAVIGDGSLTGGMAYEALNNAGHTVKDFIIILNDNEMSISKNVGAMPTYLNKIITSPIYKTVKKDLQFVLKKIPAIGETMVKTARQLEESIKSFIVPGIIFEEMGFAYFGPVDGHNIHNLIYMLNSIKDIDRPTLLHVVTKKGKGYRYAEIAPEKFHGANPFDIERGEPISKKSTPTYTDIFSTTICKLAESNRKIVAITPAMAHGTGLARFAEKFPDRFFDVGIAEAHAVTFAAGLAASGYKPFVAIYSTFLQRAYDSIVHDVALQNLPVVFAIDRAGVVGEDGPTHHGTFDISFLRHIPNLIVMQPKDEDELQDMLKTAESYDKGPIAVRYPRKRGFGVPLKDRPQVIPLGKSEIVRKSRSKDAVIIALGPMVQVGLEAASLLEQEGIDMTVVNARFIKPLDKALLKELSRKSSTFFTIEEGVLQGGFGSAVLEALRKEDIHTVRVSPIALPDEFAPHGRLDELYQKYGLTPQAIASRIKEDLARFGAGPHKKKRATRRLEVVPG